MKKYFLILIASSILYSCKSVPNDKSIQSSLDKNVEFYKQDTNPGSWGYVNDSLKNVFIGKTKISNKEIKVYYSHEGKVYDDIKLFCLDNGKWIMEWKKNIRWEVK